ncbi:MAG: hydrogen gas-evolving membrane-bound hydrogenase subunit E [Syntrophales bacterium]
MKIIKWLLLTAFGALLMYAATGLPNRGDSAAGMHAIKSLAGSPGASSFYIRNALKDAETPNMVTVILADYRGFDTLGEETVILTAGLICFLVLRKRKKSFRNSREQRHMEQ